MRRIVYSVMSVVAVAIMLAGCHRNYKVIHARPAIDTLAHNGDESEVGDRESIMDEPLIDIPEAPQESDFDHVTSKDRKEYDDFMKGL